MDAGVVANPQTDFPRWVRLQSGLSLGLSELMTRLKSDPPGHLGVTMTTAAEFIMSLRRSG